MPHTDISYYEFGQYRLDPAERVLTRDGEAVSLTPKATETLLVLLRNAGQLVSKETLMREVWPDTFVEESNLTQNIFILRRVLGDDGNGVKYIETVSRRGYRFVAAVRRSSESDDPISSLEGANRETSFASPTILAVCPFMNATGDAKAEYLPDGITDGVINRLSRIPNLRVMSRSALSRYKDKGLDPQTIGQELGADAVLIGRVSASRSGLFITAELVDVANGWQLWGESFDRASRDILEIQDEIVRQLSAKLKLELSGDDEKRVTKRYTESSAAHEAYLEGRYHWSTYTRNGIEKAIVHFRRATDLDPNYALAYAGIVDCYLRLATSYLPPEEALPPAPTEEDERENESGSVDVEVSQEKVRLRHEWDWKGAERELRRANELKSDYPAAYQWHAACQFSVKLFQESLQYAGNLASKVQVAHLWPTTYQSRHIPSLDLTPAEEVQVLCTIAREQIDVGNYEAACLVLHRWCTIGEWPKLEGLSSYSAADLLFTVGSLASSISSTGRVQKGQKHAEALLNGSIALFEQLGSKTRSAEGRIELARCYYREGLFDTARTTLNLALSSLASDQGELRCSCLILFGVVERDAGRLRDSLSRLNEAATIVEVGGPRMTGRCHYEMATTFRELAISEFCDEYFDRAIDHFRKALHKMEGIGNHRHTASLENNHGYLLLSLGRSEESELHLLRSRRLFDVFADSVRRAQVDDTLARLYLATQRFELAEQTIARAVSMLEISDEEALLAEALTTKAMILCKVAKYHEAKAIFEGAYRVAERCGDSEGAGRAQLIMLEEMCEQLEDSERLEITMNLTTLLATSQQASIVNRLEELKKHIASNHGNRQDCDGAE